MKVAIHQPHYFPWIGYFDKVAKVDKFVLMDEVQLENRSYMCRNRFVNKEGDIIFLTVSSLKSGYRSKKYNEIRTFDNEKWQKRHQLFLRDTFKYSPYYEEVMVNIEPVFKKDYKYLFEVTKDSIVAITKMLEINTEILTQSSLKIKQDSADFLEREKQRSTDILNICLSAGASEYLTGAGASLEFLDAESFAANCVTVTVQQYDCPIYYQRHSKEFVSNISALDLLFNCGIKESKRVFWENVKKSKEFETYYRK